jgi:hypothetical protein
VVRTKRSFGQLFAAAAGLVHRDGDRGPRRTPADLPLLDSPQDLEDIPERRYGGRWSALKQMTEQASSTKT